MDTQTPQPILPPDHPERNWFLRHWVAYVLIGLFTLVMVAGSYYWYIAETQVVETNQNSTPCAGVPQTPGNSIPCGGVTEAPVNPTISLLIYRNDQYGYEFVYPSDWGIRELSASVSDFLPDNRKFVAIYPNGYPAQDYSAAIDVYALDVKKVLATHPFLQGESSTIETIGGYAWVKIHANYLIERNGLTYHIFGDAPYLDQILSTFKFMDVAKESGNKTYTDSETGIEFNYPSPWQVSGQAPYIYVGKDAKDLKDISLQIDFACIYATEGAVNPVVENSKVTYNGKTYDEIKTYDLQDGKKVLVFDFVEFPLSANYKNSNPETSAVCPVGTFIISPSANRADVDKVISSFKFTK